MVKKGDVVYLNPVIEDINYLRPRGFMRRKGYLITNVSDTPPKDDAPVAITFTGFNSHGIFEDFVRYFSPEIMRTHFVDSLSIESVAASTSEMAERMSEWRESPLLIRAIEDRFLRYCLEVRKRDI